MPQVIRCPHCQRSMQVPDNAAGKTVRCPVCQKPFGVPAATPVPVAAGVGNGPTPKPSPSITFPTIPAPGASGQPCPSCGSMLLPGAIACMDCGYLLQGDGVAVEAEGPGSLEDPPGGRVPDDRDRVDGPRVPSGVT